jgi:enoyl-CoA hydratase
MTATTLMETPTLTATLEDGIASVVLTRPEVMNRFDAALHEDFIEMIEQVNANFEVRVMLLSSQGRAFSAGGDVHMMREVQSDAVHARHMVRQGHRLMQNLLALRVPLVCAVQGAAMGLGANVAFAADAVVAVAGAKFADSHVVMGLVAGDGGAVVWPQTGGMLLAKRHLLTGDPITGADAKAAGMVSDLVESEADLLPTALALATRLAALPPLAVQGTKQALNRVLQQRAGEVFELSLQLELDSMRSEDLLEATSAFLEKRPGRYQGR